MLHCPRCSGPLEVATEAAIKPFSGGQPASAVSAGAARSAFCPAGHLCPHSSVNTIAPPTSTINKSVNYLSGGSVFMDFPKKPVNDEAKNFSPQSSPHSTSRSQINLQSSLHHPSPASSVNLSLNESLMLATTLASLPHQHQQLQQQQQQQQQQQLQMQNQLQPLISNLSHQQQQHLILSQPATVVVTTAHPHMSGLAIHQHLQGSQTTGAAPVFLTSTINQPSTLEIQSPLGISTLCQPQTPAIVVGSTGSPFFSQQGITNNPLAVPGVSPASTLPSSHHNISCQNFPLFTPPPNLPMPLPKHENVPCSTTHEILSRNKEELSQCNWYYPNMKWNESSDILENAIPGTFLVRDSADHKFLFSLSVQREQGPTSVRIHFNRKRFSLDAEDSIRSYMPEFESVIALIHHYCSSSFDKVPGGHKNVWIDCNGIQKLNSPISLRTPLLKRVPSLSHWSRLAINKRLSENQNSSRTGELNLPKALVTYLNNYPHKI